MIKILCGITLFLTPQGEPRIPTPADWAIIKQQRCTSAFKRPMCVKSITYYANKRHRFVVCAPPKREEVGPEK